jgi:hypothetical protein
MSIALVHGGFVDGSGWESVYKLLRADGQAVTIVQNPTTSLADDVAVTTRAIDQQNEPVVLAPIVREKSMVRPRPISWGWWR